MKNDSDCITDKIDFTQLTIALIVSVTVISIVIFGMIPMMEIIIDETKAYDAMTPEERVQYEKETKQQMYEERIDIYVDTETGIEYLIYKDTVNDVIIPRYDEHGNIKTNSTYLELK